MSYLNTLLQDKLEDHSEIEVRLFDYCNLKCSFCSVKTDSKEGLDTIRDKAYLIVDWIKQSPLNSHRVSIMAGELFQDGLPEHVWDDYYFLVKYVQDYCKLHGQELRVNFVTNLIFQENVPRLQRLIKRLGENVFISPSYDLSGRGLDINRTLTFKRNIETFKDRIDGIGFVLTRPTIKKLFKTAKTDKYFNYLYQTFPIYFDYFTPEVNVEKMLPSEEEMLQAYEFIAENYPNIEPIHSLLEGRGKMTCFSLNKTVILNNGRQVVCRNYTECKEEDYLTPIDFDSNENIIEAYLERYGCLSCEYYKQCTFRCFVQADYRHNKRLPNNQCWLKEFLNRRRQK